MTRKNLARLAAQSARISVAAPVVIGERLARMATASAARDSQEINRMHTEKAAAWAESWTAIGVEIARSQQHFAFDLTRAWFRACTNLAFAGWRPYPWQTAALAIMTSGLAPFERRVAANYRRLTAITR